MAPVLEPDDRLITRRVPPVAGDVVVARSPTGRTVVKRAVAVGPAEVTLSAEAVLVDGVVSPWSPPDGVPGAGRWDLDTDHVFLLSDAAHRTDADSRAWGPLPPDAVLGVVRWRYRPLGRVGRIG